MVYWIAPLLDFHGRPELAFNENDCTDVVACNSVALPNTADAAARNHVPSVAAAAIA